jgi:glycosyltransferase involved in cell wall biosynthesis
MSLVSVISPRYKRAEYIERAMASRAGANLYGDLEVIIVDDGSRMTR